MFASKRAVSSAVASFTVPLVLASLACRTGAGQDDPDAITYDKIVDILKIDVVPAAKKNDNPTIEFTFNLHPLAPEGAKVEFELRYQYLPYERGFYTLESANRKNLKFAWKPKKRLPVDEYQLRTSMPLKEQTAQVQKAIAAQEKAFPADQEPWPWSYPQFPIKVGTDADRRAEEKAVKQYFKETIRKILELNNEFITELDALDEGTKYVTGGKVDTKALAEYAQGWITKFGELQLSIDDYESTEPGLYKKNEAAHFQLGRLARLVAKRCWYELKDRVEAKGGKFEDLKLDAAVKGFSYAERGRVTPKILENVYNAIDALVHFSEEAEETAEKKGDGEGGR